MIKKAAEEERRELTSSWETLTDCHLYAHYTLPRLRLAGSKEGATHRLESLPKERQTFSSGHDKIVLKEVGSCALLDCVLFSFKSQGSIRLAENEHFQMASTGAVLRSTVMM